jgi:hypothetical protein
MSPRNRVAGRRHIYSRFIVDSNGEPCKLERTARWSHRPVDPERHICLQQAVKHVNRGASSINEP